MDVHPVYAPPPVIEPGHTFGTVTEKIAAIVLTRRHPYSWFFGLFVGFMLSMMLLMTVEKPRSSRGGPRGGENGSYSGSPPVRAARSALRSSRQRRTRS